MASQNGIVGDDYGIEIPETHMQEDQLAEEKKAAKYSKTTEFKRLQEHMKSRIEFYQTSLPNGERPSVLMDPALRGHQWAVANDVIMELSAILNFYETANETVKNAEKG